MYGVYSYVLLYSSGKLHLKQMFSATLQSIKFVSCLPQVLELTC